MGAMSLYCTVSQILSLISPNLKTSRDHDYAYARDNVRKLESLGYCAALFAFSRFDTMPKCERQTHTTTTTVYTALA